MRSIFAIAFNTLRQALRLKIALIFIVLMAVLVPVMGLTIDGDGTIKGRLQSYVNYGMSLITILMSLLTVIVITYTITEDVKRKQIYMVLTKPVRRFEFLVGKLLGVLLLDAILLTIFSVVMYAIIVLTPNFEKISDLDKIKLKNEFFTARKSINPLTDKPTEQAIDKQIAFLIEMGKFDPDIREDKRRFAALRRTIEKDLEKAPRSVGPGEQIFWKFENIKVVSDDSDEALFVRYRFGQSSRDETEVWTQWLVGDFRDIRAGKPPQNEPISTPPMKEPVASINELPIPLFAVNDEGYLEVAFYNMPNNGSSIIFEEFELLYKADSFLSNYIKNILLVFTKLIYLACLGVLAASFLSLPVALLLCWMVFAIAAVSGFVLDSFEMMSQGATLLYSFTITPLVNIISQASNYVATENLVSANSLSWLELGKTALISDGIIGLMLFFIGLLFFNLREIARVIV